MENHLRQIQKRASLDAQTLMVVATLRSGEMRNLGRETAIYQVLTQQGCLMNGRPFQVQKNVKKVIYLLFQRKSNISEVYIFLIYSFLV